MTLMDKSALVPLPVSLATTWQFVATPSPQHTRPAPLVVRSGVHQAAAGAGRGPAAPQPAGPRRRLSGGHFRPADALAELIRAGAEVRVYAAWHCQAPSAQSRCSLCGPRTPTSHGACRHRRCIVGVSLAPAALLLWPVQPPPTGSWHLRRWTARSRPACTLSSWRPHPRPARWRQRAKRGQTTSCSAWRCWWRRAQVRRACRAAAACPLAASRGVQIDIRIMGVACFTMPAYAKSTNSSPAWIAALKARQSKACAPLFGRPGHPKQGRLHPGVHSRGSGLAHLPGDPAEGRGQRAWHGAAGTHATGGRCGRRPRGLRAAAIGGRRTCATRGGECMLVRNECEGCSWFCLS